MKERCYLPAPNCDFNHGCPPAAVLPPPTAFPPSLSALSASPSSMAAARERSLGSSSKITMLSSSARAKHQETRNQYPNNSNLDAWKVSVCFHLEKVTIKSTIKEPKHEKGTQVGPHKHCKKRHTVQYTYLPYWVVPSVSTCQSHVSNATIV